MVKETTFKKIKMDEKSVYLEYFEHLIPDAEKEEDFEPLNNIVTYKSEVKPHRDFFDSFQALKDHALMICELSKFKGKVNEEDRAKFVVRGVSIFDDMTERKVIISGLKYISSGKCYSVNTPLSDVEDSEGLEELMKDLVREARLFLNGKNGSDQLNIEFKMSVAS